uniref:A disintegrin and metalloproteinase with thrombospondin motifs 8 n=1 Tax=Aceria tosichella TaxID=561515 RepID=A0A6G1SQ26_9ACAR
MDCNMVKFALFIIAILVGTQPHASLGHPAQKGEPSQHETQLDNEDNELLAGWGYGVPSGISDELASPADGSSYWGVDSSDNARTRTNKRMKRAALSEQEEENVEEEESSGQQTKDVVDDYEDKLKAIHYIFTEEVSRRALSNKMTPAEKVERLNILINLAAAIKAYFPMPDLASIQFIEAIHEYLTEQRKQLIAWMHDDNNQEQKTSPLSDFNLRSLEQVVKRLEAEGKRLPEIKSWKYCGSSGYPCALWRLFHTLTSFEYEKKKKEKKDEKNYTNSRISSSSSSSWPSSSSEHQQARPEQANTGTPTGSTAGSAGARPKQRVVDHQDGTTISKETLHKLMSEKDLRRTFQVETHDQVPEYQVLKLTVTQDGSHLISPISDLGELLITTTNQHHRHPKQHNEQHHQNNQDKQRSHDQESSLDAKPDASLSKQIDDDDLDDRNTRTSSEAHSRVKRSSTERTTGQPQATSRQEEQSRHRQQQQRQSPTSSSSDHHQDDRLIVMNLSTFGQDFSLRLKRNADFQQRIKDMKMFLAESSSDGSLRYTEIKNPTFHQHHHKQEPHKRAASNDAGELADLLEDSHSMHQQQMVTSSGGSAKTASAAANATSRPQESGGQQQQAGGGQTADKKQQQHDWNIGSTYHDEENLAALLIERDRITGQIKVDGTIGNDFVIKPMPKATIEALLAKQRLAEQQQAATAAKSAPGSGTASSEPNVANTVAGATAASAAPLISSSSSTSISSSSANELKLAAGHLHDDDPHDDDEMFLDEDEALELANLNETIASGARVATNSSSTQASAGPLPQRQQQQQQARTLSKAASERKWRKYRKLMAQTQVPKPGSSHNQQNQEQRVRRHTTSDRVMPDVHSNRAEQTTTAEHSSPQSQPQHFRMSHHIIYRQRPSSEASSSEHKHSFMMAPGQQSMEAMVRRFPASKQLNKRSTEDNMIDGGAGAAASRLSRDDLAGPEADYAHDPLGGQFYLEPGSVTGFERAGYADWSLVSSGSSNRRPALAAPPPYAFNSSNIDHDDDDADYAEEHHASYNQSTTMDLQRRRTLPTGAAATNSSQQQHARYKRHLAGGGPRLSAASPPHIRTARASASNRRQKRQAPDVVWPEVLLVVDYDSFLLHGGDSREVKRYFVSFWNGVDLRYKLLVNPHIRISLAGMIVAKDRDATPYLERNRLRAPNADAVDAAGALTDMGKYLYREDRLPTYDLAVVITKLDMCRRRYEGGRCNRGTAGFAYVGGACVVNKRLEKVNSVAIIEDSGGFSGIIVAAHEVGHLLGCVHDGSPPPSYLGGPGATHCPWEDGFIMSDLRHTERGFRWSQCSVEQFKHFLNGETATCLYNYPHESQMLHRLLPGSMLSLDDQCKRDRGTNACFKDARVCAQLFCFDSASGYCVSYRPAAEGSPCGDGHVCRNGKCVGEIENIIPDYTHQSQTVVAATGIGARQRSLATAGSSPGAATAAVGSAMVPVAPRLTDNGLSASSTSTATSSPDGGGGAGSTSAKLLAGNGAPSIAVGGQQSSAGQVSSRRMDTIQVDTPLDVSRTGHLYQPTTSQRSDEPNHYHHNTDIQQQQSLPINYHHQQQHHYHHQAPPPPAATQNSANNLSTRSQYQRQGTTTSSAAPAAVPYKGPGQLVSKATAAAMRGHQKLSAASHHYNSNNNNNYHQEMSPPTTTARQQLHHQQQQLSHQTATAAAPSTYADPYAYTPQRSKHDHHHQATSLRAQTGTNELYAAAASSSTSSVLPHSSSSSSGSINSYHQHHNHQSNKFTR